MPADNGYICQGEANYFWPVDPLLEKIDCFIAHNGLIITGQPYNFIIVINGRALIYQAMLEESHCYYYRILLWICLHYLI